MRGAIERSIVSLNDLFGSSGEVKFVHSVHSSAELALKKIIHSTVFAKFLKHFSQERFNALLV